MSYVFIFLALSFFAIVFSVESLFKYLQNSDVTPEHFREGIWKQIHSLRTVLLGTSMEIENTSANHQRLCAPAYEIAFCSIPSLLLTHTNKKQEYIDIKYLH